MFQGVLGNVGNLTDVEVVLADLGSSPNVNGNTSLQNNEYVKEYRRQ